MIIGCLIASIALNMALIAGYVDMVKYTNTIIREDEKLLDDFIEQIGKEDYSDLYD